MPSRRIHFCTSVLAFLTSSATATHGDGDASPFPLTLERPQSTDYHRDLLARCQDRDSLFCTSRQAAVQSRTRPGVAFIAAGTFFSPTARLSTLVADSSYRARSLKQPANRPSREQLGLPRRREASTLITPAQCIRPARRPAGLTTRLPCVGFQWNRAIFPPEVFQQKPSVQAHLDGPHTMSDTHK